MVDPTSPAPVLLSVRGLTVGLHRGRRVTTLVRGVDLDVAAGERVSIVGESGSGKSLTLLSIIGLLSRPALRITAGSITWDGVDLRTLSDRAMRRRRGREIAMVYQDPMTSLDPMLRIGVQVAEGLRVDGVSRDDARARVLSALEEVGLPAPDRTAQLYPHELSGGMRQRVMIASALVGNPDLLLADEPTTALDVTIQQQIIRLVSRIQRDRSMAVIWVTHDLGVVAQFAQRVAVMYAGRIVETGSAADVFARPTHPYTAALLASLPTSTGPRTDLRQIPGAPPDPAAIPSGCSFRPRCTQVIARCHTDDPPLLPRGADAAACWVPPERWTKTAPR